MIRDTLYTLRNKENQERERKRKQENQERERKRKQENQEKGNKEKESGIVKDRDS